MKTTTTTSMISPNNYDESNVIITHPPSSSSKISSLPLNRHRQQQQQQHWRRQQRYYSPHNMTRCLLIIATICFNRAWSFQLGIPPSSRMTTYHHLYQRTSRPITTTTTTPHPLTTSSPLTTQITTTTTTPTTRTITTHLRSTLKEQPTTTTTTLPESLYKKALFNTLLTILFSSLFGLAIWHYKGPIASQEFFAGYLVEQSLSLDNLFVFLLLFEYFKVPLNYQNRVLNWGIFGAVVMRAIMISLGSVALKNFHAVLLVFAALLVYSSGKMLVDLSSAGDEDEEDEGEDMSQNTIVKFSKSLFPTTDEFDGDRFFSVVDGVKMATPLLLCMVAVEISDVVFAVDSVPAVFGVTEDPFIVFTSNMCAILGLRSLYTILSKAASDLKYLEPAVAIVLGFIGAKLLLEYFGIIIGTTLSLTIVAGLLSMGIGASLLFADDAEEEEEKEVGEEGDLVLEQDEV